MFFLDLIFRLQVKYDLYNLPPFFGPRPVPAVPEFNFEDKEAPLGIWRSI